MTVSNVVSRIKGSSSMVNHSGVRDGTDLCVAIGIWSRELQRETVVEGCELHSEPVRTTQGRKPMGWSRTHRGVTRSRVCLVRAGLQARVASPKSILGELIADVIPVRLL